MRKNTCPVITKSGDRCKNAAGNLTLPNERRVCTAHLRMWKNNPDSLVFVQENIQQQIIEHLDPNASTRARMEEAMRSLGAVKASEVRNNINPGPITKAYLNKEKHMPIDKPDVTTTMISGWNNRKVCDDLETAVPLVLEVSGTTVLIVPGVTTTKWMRKPGTPKKQQVAMLLPLYEAGIVAALRLGITVKVVPIIGFDFDRIEMDDEERSMLTFTDKKITWDQYVFFAAKKDMVIYGDMGNIKDDNAVVLY